MSTNINAAPSHAPAVGAPAALRVPPALRVTRALNLLREICPRGVNCEHTSAVSVFRELEAVESDLRESGTDHVHRAALARIACTSDEQCHAGGAWDMRAQARAALGIPAAGADRVPVQPQVCLTRLPEMPTQFTASQWRTPEQQQEDLTAFSRFLAAGCRPHDFTNQVYQTCTSDLGFIAHYDRRQFYGTYFRSWEGAEAFANQVGTAYVQRGWGSAHHQELKTALFLVTHQHGVRPGAA
jgi:hypothetical protein